MATTAVFCRGMIEQLAAAAPQSRRPSRPSCRSCPPSESHIPPQRRSAPRPLLSGLRRSCRRRCADPHKSRAHPECERETRVRRRDLNRCARRRRTAQPEPGCASPLWLYTEGHPWTVPLDFSGKNLAVVAHQRDGGIGNLLAECDVLRLSNRGCDGVQVDGAGLV